MALVQVHSFFLKVDDDEKPTFDRRESCHTAIDDFIEYANGALGSCHILEKY